MAEREAQSGPFCHLALSPGATGRSLDSSRATKNVSSHESTMDTQHTHAVAELKRGGDLLRRCHFGAHRRECAPLAFALLLI